MSAERESQINPESNRERIIELRTTFKPFEQGFTQDADFYLPAIEGAFGYSPTFIIPGIGKARVELFHDSFYRLPAHKKTALNPATNSTPLRYYDIVPALPIPVIYFDDPILVDPDIKCISYFKDLVLDEVSIGEDGFNEMAIFSMWENENLRQDYTKRFYTEDDLKSLELTFVRPDDEFQPYTDVIDDDGWYNI